MKRDTIKFVYEMTARALVYEKKLSAIPVQTYYDQSSLYFKLLEKRNEILDTVRNTLNNEMGYKIPRLRVHERNARRIYEVVAELSKSLAYAKAA